MCYFVLVGFAPEALPAARGLLRSTYHLTQTVNATVAAALPNGWIASYLSDEMCGCDMYANPIGTEGEVTLEDRIITFRRSHEKPKYRKQGWSDPKIARAIEQMRNDASLRPVRNQKGLRRDVKRAIVELAEMTRSSVYTLVHFFSEEIDTEAIDNVDHRCVTPDAFVSDDLMMEPDTWYELVPQQAK